MLVGRLWLALATPLGKLLLRVPRKVLDRAPGKD
jgi:hypothetical protein